MKRILVWTGLLVITAGAPAFAQAHVEITGFAGWVFSDGVSGDARIGYDGQLYDRVDPKDSPNFGFSVGVLASDNAEVGFMYSRQSSTLVAAGPNSEREIGDMAVTGYHGYFGYNWGDSDAVVRPFFFGGLGATNFGEVTGTIGGDTRTISSGTQFSTIWGAGVKIYPAPGFGLRVGMHWSPTYIKSDPGGVWCDPWYGFCYVVGNAQYSNQWQINGGVSVRF